MSYTLSTLLVDVYGELGQLTVSTATGGTTSTIVDSKQGDQHGDEDSIMWSAFIIEDAGGESAAPEGEMALVTSYTDSTGTFTSAASSWTVAPATGDIYAWANDFYPYYDTIRALNRGLKALGEIPLVDTTTLDVVAGQTEYTYATTWKRNPPFRVDLETKEDTDDNQWRHRGYYLLGAIWQGRRWILRGQCFECCPVVALVGGELGVCGVQFSQPAAAGRLLWPGSGEAVACPGIGQTGIVGRPGYPRLLRITLQHCGSAYFLPAALCINGYLCRRGCCGDVAVEVS